jgi:hypothetical protein
LAPCWEETDREESHCGSASGQWSSLSSLFAASKLLEALEAIINSKDFPRKWPAAQGFHWKKNFFRRFHSKEQGQSSRN